MNSIIQTEKECFFCHSTRDLHKHHIFFGSANRKLSEEYGCWCWLCANHHNMSSEGVHFDKKKDLRLKQITQEVWEAQNGNRDDFRAIFGKSYL